jgi:hypothetical protein
LDIQQLQKKQYKTIPDVQPIIQELHVYFDTNSSFTLDLANGA